MPKNAANRLQQLIAERQRYEEWLAGLEARRAAAPAHVVSRVEEDYRGKLARVHEELAARAGELRERIDGVTQRLAAVDRDEAGRRDARAESELRTAVGEYTPEQWTSLSGDIDRELAAFAAQRKTLSEELAHLNEILAQSSGAAGAAASATAPAAAAAPAAPTPAAAAPRAAPTPAPQPATPASLFDQTAPGKSTMPRERSGRHTPSKSRSHAMQPPRGEQDKTLKCAECGTMNYPTEWYCESCGAELAAM